MKIRTVDNLESYLVGKKTRLGHQLLVVEMKEVLRVNPRFLTYANEWIAWSFTEQEHCSITLFRR